MKYFRSYTREVILKNRRSVGKIQIRSFILKTLNLIIRMVLVGMKNY